MSCTNGSRWGAPLLAIALLALAPLASAAITPESDVLLPWFEIDLNHPDTGLTTTFSIVNASPSATRTRVTVYTNWGIPVLEVPLELGRTEAKTIDLRVWIATGVLPGRTLTQSELAQLQAALTGKPSPADGLYYGSVVKDGLAAGYVIAQTLDARPDSLWGDTYTVDVAGNSFGAETLTALTHGLKADCARHGIRFVNEGDLYNGAELIIWSGRRLSPSATAAPSEPKMKVTIAVYDQAGHHVQDCYRELIAVEPLQVCHLDVTPPIGWLDVKTEDPTVIIGHLHSTTQASAELHSYCLPETLQLAGPSIAIEKKIFGQDADGPGWKFTIGDEVAFEYDVTNNGTVPLTNVLVTDDTGITVSCPKTALDPGESMVCTARALAEGCLHINIGTATGTAPDGKKVTAGDPAYYEGLYAPALTLKTLVNDNDADEAPGPYVDAADPLHWTFVVTNTGEGRIDHVVVSRKQGEIASCPKSALDPAESMTCTAESLAAEGQQHEIGTVIGSEPCGGVITATDPAYYFGRRNAPAIDIRKFVGESDANTPSGPTLPAGSAIQWRFLVTNIGNLPLQNVIVTDDQGLAVSCPKTTLEPGESMTCTASSIALPCQRSNSATATATAAGRDINVSAHDAAHYFGEGHPKLALELKLNGDPADEPPGPWIDEGTSLLLTFEVTNPGDVELTSLVVTDDRGRTVTCPKTSLQPGESMVCTANGLAVAGTHELSGTAYGRPPCGDPLQAEDPAYYRGRALQAPSISVMKLTNGVHAEGAPGPSVAIGSTVQWTYVVTNTGTVQLTNVSVTDNREVTVTCPKAALEAGESMTCTASGIAQACQYSNTATAQGQPANGEPVTARDDGFYYGQPNGVITVDKRVNGQDASQPPGPSINTGATIQWTFAITNAGDVTLTDITVTDDRASAVTCPKSTLAPGESMTCTAAGTALAGQQRNVVDVSGKPPCGDAVTATDTCHYRGVTPGISMEKLINGQDADDAAHAVQLTTGATVLWSFVVTNIGDVALSDVAVTDNILKEISCPKTALEPGESMTCTASGIAEAGLDCDTGTASGTWQAINVTSSDPACYQASLAAIAIEKLTNGSEADTPPGPQIAVGSAVQWTYRVTNTGDMQLTSVAVTDDRGVAVTCPKVVLEPGETMTCTGSGTATAGQYANIGTASGTPQGGNPVTASDPSHYLGVTAGDQGCTVGYWTNHTDSWPPAGYSPSQSVGSVFAQASLYPTLGAATLLQSLAFAGGPDVQGAAEIVLRSATAALLNASHPGVSYPRTVASVIGDVNDALATQNRDTMLMLAAALSADNNLGCPLL